MNIINSDLVREAILGSAFPLIDYKVLLAHEVRSIQCPAIGTEISALVTHFAMIKLGEPKPNHTGHHNVYMREINGELEVLAIV